MSTEELLAQKAAQMVLVKLTPNLMLLLTAEKELFFF
jgi:hypothetical protein